jgi:tRNA(Ile)-lysidine synthetase-like protein
MIKIQGKLKREIYLACSGGVDSMATLDFLSNNHNITVVFFDHGTIESKKALRFITDYTSKKDLAFIYGSMGASEKRPKDESWEEFWRKKRYEFFHSINEEIITAHHLDDCVETWVWSSMHGEGKIIPYRNKNVIRPFRATRKRDFEMWADIKNVPYVQDDSNYNTSYIRNYIRHEMMPHVLKVNPGIHKNIAKKVKADEYSTQS